MDEVDSSMKTPINTVLALPKTAALWLYAILQYMVWKSLIIVYEFKCKCCNKNITCCYFIFAIPCTLLLLMFIISTYWLTYEKMSTTYVKTYNTSHWRNKTTKTLLVWTKFFTNDWGFTFPRESPYKCEVTTDKTKIDTVDAILFNYHDLGSIPEYRNPGQIWIVHNSESPPHSKGTKDKNAFRHLFNWTMGYRAGSTVVSTYGAFRPLSRKDQLNYHPKNFAKNRTKMAASIISNCHDTGKRYRILNELANYIQIDRFGKCGNKVCPQEQSNICRTSEYRFRIAFENSKCRDYVTEKYFRSLEDGVIPVVNWVRGQKPAFILNNSYINFYDFKSVANLAKYLVYVSQHDDVFNSYFEWKRNFSPDLSGLGPFNLCRELHTPHVDQQIEDLEAWVKDDIQGCEPNSGEVIKYRGLAFGNREDIAFARMEKATFYVFPERYFVQVTLERSTNPNRFP